MDVVLMVLASGVVLCAAYFTFGSWLARRVFRLDDANPTPAVELNDGADYVPTKKSIIFGHHFTSIAGTGPIVGPAIAVMWGWVPALVWVVFGSIFVGAVHDLGAIVVSLRKKGRSIGDIAGDLLGPRARVIFLGILVMGLWLVLAVFGLVIASVLRQYPAAIFPVLVQTPLAILVGWLIYRRKIAIAIPSLCALAAMYASVVWGDELGIHAFNAWMAGLPLWIWVVGLLAYAYIASVIPVWVLLQPRDYINALQLVTALGLLVVGLGVAAARYGGEAPGISQQASAGPTTQSSQLRAETGEEGNTLTDDSSGDLVGSAPSPLAGEGGERSEPGEGYSPRLSLVAPAIDWSPPGAPPILPVLFITVACGACSGFHCLVGSGTTSKQLARERDAKAVGYGSMVTEGFLAVIVIAACAGGIGLGTKIDVSANWSAAVGTDGRIMALGHLRLRSAHANRVTSVFALRSGEEPPPEPALITLFGSREPENPVLEGLIIPPQAPDLEWGTATQFDGGKVTKQRYYETGGVRTFMVPSPDTAHEWIRCGDSYVRQTEDWGTLEAGGTSAFDQKYASWQSAGSLASTVGAFVEGGANFLAALAIPRHIAIALMAVMVASFAATTMDTSCRLQRYVVQELSRVALIGRRSRHPDGACPACGYDLAGIDPERAVTHDAGEARKRCPECNALSTEDQRRFEGVAASALAQASWFNPIRWLTTTHGATLFAVLTACALAFIPPTGQAWSLANAGQGAMVLWPLFGAVNQLLAGFAFVVIIAWLRVTNRPWWFAVLPALLMLVMPAWALAWQAFVGDASTKSWVSLHKWPLVVTAGIALALEAWLVIEAMARWPRARLAKV